MKKLLLATLLFLVPSAAYAQSFNDTEACQQLKGELNKAVSTASGIEALLTDNSIDTEKYLEELYKAVQLLTQSGELFFKAADAYESDCTTALKQANKLEDIRPVYDLYLQPVKQAYEFFGRAKSQAIRLGRQKDVETFIKAMREYEDSVLKIAATCESTLEGTSSASTCRVLSSQLEDALK